MCSIGFVKKYLSLLRNLECENQVETNDGFVNTKIGCLIGNKGYGKKTLILKLIKNTFPDWDNESFYMEESWEFGVSSLVIKQRYTKHRQRKETLVITNNPNRWEILAKNSDLRYVSNLSSKSRPGENDPHIFITTPAELNKTNKERKAWRRVIVDEPHLFQNKKILPVHARFYWVLSSHSEAHIKYSKSNNLFQTLFGPTKNFTLDKFMKDISIHIDYADISKELCTLYHTYYHPCVVTISSDFFSLLQKYPLETLSSLGCKLNLSECDDHKDEICSICLSTPEIPLLTNCCSKYLCALCILKWLNKNKKSCPNCRASLSHCQLAYSYSRSYQAFQTQDDIITKIVDSSVDNTMIFVNDSRSFNYDFIKIPSGVSFTYINDQHLLIRKEQTETISDIIFLEGGLDGNTELIEKAKEFVGGFNSLENIKLHLLLPLR